MKTKIKINFLSKLHLACSSDELRPILQTIFFKGGKAYATNGHLVVRQSISVHSIDPDDHENLEGKFIHKDIFKEIVKHPTAKFNPGNIEVTTSVGEKITFNYYKTEEKFPDADNIFDMHESKSIDEISFNPEYLRIINECLVKDGSSGSLKYMFNDKNRGILITTNDLNKDSQLAMLMPAMIYCD